jgi:competence protein ComEA
MKSFRNTALACMLALAAMNPVAAAEPVDINTASAEVLADTIDGVGVKRAQAIIEFRESNGPFASLDGLLAIRGIGLRVLDKARDRLTVK